ncbi:mechanosensitive ion channel domain-containing protein [Chloroflexota bacterium]
MDWDSVTDWLSDHGVKIAVIIVLSFVTYILLRKIVPSSLHKTLSSTMVGSPQVEIEKRRVTLTNLFSAGSSILIVTIAVFLILSEVGINIAALIAGFGVAGIAIGFGAQSLVKDLIAGFVIMLENQYNVGDVVRIADTRGIVEAVNLRRTLMRDLDGMLHVIPNGEIKTTGNYTRTWSRAHLNISVAYKEDLDHVMSIIRKTWEELAEDPDWGTYFISKTPWILRVDDFGDSGIVIKVVGETQPIRQWDVMGELRRRIKKVFDQQGIEIPWPHSKVYFGQNLNPSEKEHLVVELQNQAQASQQGNTAQEVEIAGANVKPGMIVCGQCGAENQSGHKFCHTCGAKLAD